MPHNDIKKQLESHFGNKIDKIFLEFGQLNLIVSQDNYYDCILSLRDNFFFEQMIDLTAIDFLTYGKDDNNCDNTFKNDINKDDRFAVVVHLLSYAKNIRIRIKTYCTDNQKPNIASICPIYPVANWFEREAYDLLGINFKNHPDLRRILSDYGFKGHPLRKDFPLGGEVEIIYDEKQNKVVYQETSHQERVLVPRVLKNKQQKK
jgi:NADH-quinone oxidoreductase subunit C